MFNQLQYCKSDWIFNMTCEVTGETAAQHLVLFGISSKRQTCNMPNLELDYGLSFPGNPPVFSSFPVTVEYFDLWKTTWSHLETTANQVQSVSVLLFVCINDKHLGRETFDGCSGFLKALKCPLGVAGDTFRLLNCVNLITLVLKVDSR